jgi:hypothetical protein
MFFLRLRLIYAKPTPHKLGADLVQETDTETIENTAFDRHGTLCLHFLIGIRVVFLWHRTSLYEKT